VEQENTSLKPGYIWKKCTSLRCNDMKIRPGVLKEVRPKDLYCPDCGTILIPAKYRRDPVFSINNKRKNGAHKWFVLPFLFLLASCTEATYKNYYYVGERAPFAQCKTMSDSSCGIYLFNCTNGKSYSCLTNVETRP
jgi:hypothetical protein